MVKVGDRVKVSGEFGGDSRNGLGVIKIVYSLTVYGVLLDSGRYVVARDGNIFSITTPPQKITQNGYEYSLVGPVKPEWLVDGAWVVRKDNGCKHQVVLNKNGFLVLTMPGTNATILPTHHIYDQYRSHEPKDWKWGDWAIYAGRKVFVIGKGNWMGDIRVSHPDLLDGVAYVSVLSLTPTF